MRRGLELLDTLLSWLSMAKDSEEVLEFSFLVRLCEPSPELEGPSEVPALAKADAEALAQDP